MVDIRIRNGKTRVLVSKDERSAIKTVVQLCHALKEHRGDSSAEEAADALLNMWRLRFPLDGLDEELAAEKDAAEGDAP